MLIDITLQITPEMVRRTQTNDTFAVTQALVGHLGTHFDVMNKVFPLEYTRRPGVVFDVRDIRGRDIDLRDVDLDRVEKDTFVAFCTGFVEEVGYGTHDYYANQPQLSDALIDSLVQRGVSIIGIDFAGVRRGAEHTPKDQYCADRGVFILENLCNLGALVGQTGKLTIHTYPMNYAEQTGLPCRVIAETA